MRGQRYGGARPGPARIALWGVLGVVGFFGAAPSAADRAVAFVHPVGLAAAGQATGHRRLVPVPSPDLTRLEAAVQERFRAAQSDFALVVQDPDVTDEALSETYGEMGRLYHAHHLPDSAEACYRNAQTLAPKTFRWPYLLGYLHHAAGHLAQAVASYERAVKIRPHYVPAELRLAQVYLGLNEPDRAKTLLQDVLAKEGFKGVAAFELGRVAFARRAYREAVKWFEQALEAQPGASQIHYPLAMAYRALGDIDRAKRHLERHGGVQLEIPDPLVEALSPLLIGARTHFYRGIKAAQAKQYDRAAQEFRETLVLDPENVRARVSLARTLYLLGDRKGAHEQLGAALRRQPKHDEANYFMGRLLEETGSDAAAIVHYRTALASDADHAGAQYQLANALMRSGKYEEAARHYAKFIEYAPQHLPARLMEAMALVRSEGRHKEARRHLEEALEAYPDDPVFTQALARLLAASPDDEVRDGRRALDLAQGLYNRFHSPENAETLAMAYAELGQFDKADALQRGAIALAAWSGDSDLAQRLNGNLEVYRNGKPCRTPWHDDDPLFRPGQAQLGVAGDAFPAASPD